MEIRQRGSDLGVDAEGATWRVALLGGLRLEDGRQALTRLPSRAVTALLARLALQPHRAHAREELVALLWPEADAAVGRNRLRQALSTLKAVLEPPGARQRPVLQADRLSVRVVPGALWCDALAFEQHLRQGHRSHAASLYGGDLLPGFYDEWIDDERVRLQALRDRLGEVAPPAPDRVPSPATPMRSAPPAAAPRRAPARPEDLLDSTVPTYLTRLFGTDQPGAHLQAMVCAHRLVTLIGPGGCGKTRLAVELAHAMRRQSRERPDPARADVAEPAVRFDLVAFVSLAACADRVAAIGALHDALQTDSGAGDALDAMVRGLAGRRALLVLDNFEQLAETAADLPAALAARLPGLHLLITSRRSLGLDGECLVELPTLPLPEVDAPTQVLADNPAVALFVDRARAARADFHLNPRNQQAVARLVIALQGMPLAIELAASRVRAVAPAQMLALLTPPDTARAQTATPGLDLLSRSGPRSGVDQRHASMQHVIAWSWAQLPPAARTLLGELTVFRGGADAPAVCAVAASGAQALLALDTLRSHSLLQRMPPPPGADDPDALRFDLIQPVREFAQAQLDPAEQAGLRRRHRAWAVAWAEALPAAPPLVALRLQVPNLRAALLGAQLDAQAEQPGSPLLAGPPRAADDGGCRPAGAMDDAPDCDAACQAVRLLLAAGRTWAYTGGLPYDLLGVAAGLVDRCADVGLRVRGHALLSRLYLQAVAREPARWHADQALALAPAAGLLRAVALHASARFRRWASGASAQVEALLDAAQAELPAPGSAVLADASLQRQVQEVRAGVLATRAILAHRLHGDPARAIGLHGDAVALWARLGDVHAANMARYNLTVVGARHADPAAQLAPLTELAASARAQQHWRLLSQALNVTGEVHVRRRDWAAAAAAYRESLQVAWHVAARAEIAFALWNLPRPLAHIGAAARAVQIAAFNARFWSEGHGALSAADRLDLRRVQRLAACTLTPQRRAECVRAGDALGLPQAVACALGSDGEPGD